MPTRPNKPSLQNILRYTQLGLVVLTVAGLTTGLALVSQNQDFRRFAFTGYRFLGNPDLTDSTPNFTPADSNLPQEILDDPTPLSSVPEDPNSARFLFHQLTRTYPDAANQVINNPEFSTTGIAFYQFDQSINKSLIFIRLQSLPYFVSSPLKLWLQLDPTSPPTFATTAEFFVENDTPVAYLVYSQDGPAKDQFKTATLSYDPPQSTSPVLPFMELTF